MPAQIKRSKKNLLSVEFAETLKNQDAKYSEIGAVLGCTGSAVGHWVNRDNQIGLRWAKGLALIFGLSLDDIMQPGYQYNSTHIDIDKENLIQNFKVQLKTERVKTFSLYKRLETCIELYEEQNTEPKNFDTGFKQDSNIQSVLANIEEYRSAKDLEWFIKSDGSLGARRIVIEEF